MTNNKHNSNVPSDETLIRMAADGKLTGELAAQLDALRSRDNSTNARIEAHKRLRASVARSLNEPATAPRGLRERIASAMAAVPDAEITSRNPLEQASQKSGIIETPMGNTRERSFWVRVPGVLAIAATLALVASVLIVSLSASKPLYTSQQAGTQLVSFIQNEHTACAEITDYIDRKFVARTLDEARTISGEFFGQAINVLSLDEQTWEDSGLEFVGFGPCYVPGTEKSVHVLLRHTGSDNSLVSLFAHTDDGKLNFGSETCCFVSEPKVVGGAGGGMVVAWRSEGMVYYLYSPSAESLRAARDLFSTPENEQRLL